MKNRRITKQPTSPKLLHFDLFFYIFFHILPSVFNSKPVQFPLNYDLPINQIKVMKYNVLKISLLCIVTGEDIHIENLKKIAQKSVKVLEISVGDTEKDPVLIAYSQNVVPNIYQRCLRVLIEDRCDLKKRC